MTPHAVLRLTAVRRLPVDEQSRGLVRVSPQVLAALGIGPLDVVVLEGARRTGALAAQAPVGTAPDLLLCDELLLTNLGVADGSVVEVRAAAVLPAQTVVVSAPRQVVVSLDAPLLRDTMHGKVVTAGDAVSVLVHDLPERAPANAAQVRTSVQNRLMYATQTTRVSVLDVVPPGPVLVLRHAAGAADELGELAALVDLHRVEATAEALHDALRTDGAERLSRTRRLAQSASVLPPSDWLAARLSSLWAGL